MGMPAALQLIACMALHGKHSSYFQKAALQT